LLPFHIINDYSTMIIFFNTNSTMTIIEDGMQPLSLWMKNAIKTGKLAITTNEQHKHYENHIPY